jgi:hypothetical protein
MIIVDDVGRNDDMLLVNDFNDGDDDVVLIVVDDELLLVVDKCAKDDFVIFESFVVVGFSPLLTPK